MTKKRTHDEFFQTGVRKVNDAAYERMCTGIRRNGTTREKNTYEYSLPYNFVRTSWAHSEAYTTSTEIFIQHYENHSDCTVFIYE